MSENRDAIRRFDRASRGLGQRLYERIIRISDDCKKAAQEIRLRVNKPVMICTEKDTFYLTADSKAVTEIISGKMIITTQRDIADCFQNLCSYSVYSRQNEIRKGYITMQGGHRAGLCGTAVYRNGEIYNIRDISGINLRIARELLGCADKVIEYIKDLNCGMLLCGPPCCGKTTLLRDIARQLSTVYSKKTAVIDERGELAATFSGVPQNDLGYSDVLDGFSKSDGVMHAVRCLSPDYVICDEIGTSNETSLLEESLNAGVKVIATLHAGSASELLKKPQGVALLKTGAFDKIIFLKSRENPGDIKEVLSKEDLLGGKGGRNSDDNIRRSSVGSFDFKKNNKPNFVF
ncbi:MULTISPECIES: ATPase, T2SS/T4P/T4SS family [unclassified Ruminococcus]|uniref:ATPase, T2SS/T4P/T4SS family n=1 Tax=unclassified Ruminococcus TaxID=2608920 RepID=UPI002108BA23|nr:MULTISPECIES: ATPase, T2SS/T4P/T4SS family [unclassified Ruminococcus]